MLFSDWDRSGRRDLRVRTTGSTTPRRRASSSGGSRPATAPRLYTRADGWVTSRSGAWASPATTSPATATRRSSSPARPTTSSRPWRPARAADLSRHRGSSAASPRPSPYTGGDTLPSTAWHPEFQDVNNDGFVDLFVSKGNIKRAARLRPEGSEQSAPRPAGRDLQRGWRGRRASPTFDRGRGAALADFNLDGLLDLVEVALGGPVRSGATSAAATRPSPAADGPLARPAARPAGREP